jgi:branched-subunit amino acid ABC-type transport system permease component
MHGVATAAAIRLSVFLTAFGFGLVTAGIVALAAVALSLQIGVTNVPNFAHGELLTFGAYGALIAQVLTQNLFVDALVGMAVAGITAWCMNRLVLQSFIKIGTRRIYLLVVTAGLSLILPNSLHLVFSSAILPIKVPAD